MLLKKLRRQQHLGLLHLLLIQNAFAPTATQHNKI
jgi:hypothetical protein